MKPTIIEGKNNYKKNMVVVFGTMLSVSPAFYNYGAFSSRIDFLQKVISYLLFVTLCAVLVSLIVKQRIYLFQERLDIKFGFLKRRYYLCDIEKCYLRNHSVLNLKMKNGTTREILLEQYNNSELLVDYIKKNNILIEELIV